MQSQSSSNSESWVDPMTFWSSSAQLLRAPFPTLITREGHATMTGAVAWPSKSIRTQLHQPSSAHGHHAGTSPVAKPGPPALPEMALGIVPSKSHLGAALLLWCLSFNGPQWPAVKGKEIPHSPSVPSSHSPPNLLQTTSAATRPIIGVGHATMIEFVCFLAGAGKYWPAGQAELWGRSFPC